MLLFNRINKSKDFVNALNKNGSEKVASKEEFKSIIKKERVRADRNNHKLSIVMFDMDASDPKKKTNGQLIENIRSRIRCIDEVGWYDNQRIGMILPYTSNKGATKLAEYICESIDGSTPKPLCTVYTYPSDQ